MQMPVDVRTFLGGLVSSHELSRDKADCILKEYLVLRDHYLAGKLDESAAKSMSRIRIELEESRGHESTDLPSIEETVLLTMAKKICGDS